MGSSTRGSGSQVRPAAHLLVVHGWPAIGPVRAHARPRRVRILGELAVAIDALVVVVAAAADRHQRRRKRVAAGHARQAVSHVQRRAVGGTDGLQASVDLGLLELGPLRALRILQALQEVREVVRRQRLALGLRRAGGVVAHSAGRPCSSCTPSGRSRRRSPSPSCRSGWRRRRRSPARGRQKSQRNHRAKGVCSHAALVLQVSSQRPNRSNLGRFAACARQAFGTVFSL